MGTGHSEERVAADRLFYYEEGPTNRGSTWYKASAANWGQYKVGDALVEVSDPMKR